MVDFLCLVLAKVINFQNSSLQICISFDFFASLFMNLVTLLVIFYQTSLVTSLKSDFKGSLVSSHEVVTPKT